MTLLLHLIISPFSSFFSSSLPRPPFIHFSGLLNKHDQDTHTQTHTDTHTGTSVPRLHCPTQASFMPWSGKQLEHRRCSTWAGSERPRQDQFFLCCCFFPSLLYSHPLLSTNVLIHTHMSQGERHWLLGGGTTNSLFTWLQLTPGDETDTEGKKEKSYRKIHTAPLCLTAAFHESECRDVHSYLMRAVAPANPWRDTTTGTRSRPLHFISGPY